MSAVELYEKTLELYKAELKRGRNVSLTVFCNEHHVNGRAMNKWMSSHGIYVHSLRKELLPASAAKSPRDRSSAMFAELLPPSTANNRDSSGNLEDVMFDMPEGVKVLIGTCDAIMLGILLRQLRKSDFLCSR